MVGRAEIPHVYSKALGWRQLPSYWPFCGQVVHPLESPNRDRVILTLTEGTALVEIPLGFNNLGGRLYSLLLQERQGCFPSLGAVIGGHHD
jgi:hypothetical protein